MGCKMYLPTDRLKPYIKHFWALNGSEAGSQSLRTMADGCPGIIFQHADNGSFYQQEKKLPDLFLYGQSTTFGELALHGSFNSIGIYFYPGALKAIFGISADELTDSCLDLNNEAQKDGFSLSQQLSGSKSDIEKIEFISAYLCFKLQPRKNGANNNIEYAISKIMQSGGSIALKQLQGDLQFSERSFERKFKEYVGISPKLFARIARFQSSLDLIRKKDYTKFSDIAFENEYADQSHFIRSFKEFSGFSPSQYLLNSTELAENFSQLK